MNEDQGRREHDTDQRRRRDDDIVPRIDQKLSDLITSVYIQETWVKEMIQKHDDRLTALEKLKEKIEWPAKTIGWIVITFIGGGLIWLGAKWAEIMARHVK